MNKLYTKLGFLFKKAFLENIVASIVATGILSLLGILWATNSLKTFLSTTWFKFINLYEYFVSDINVQRYTLILLFLFGLLLPAIIIHGSRLVLKIFSKSDESDIEYPEFLNYNTDIFKNIRYRWRWQKYYDGRWNMVEIQPYCSRCDCRLLSSNCNNCEAQYFTIPDENVVQTLVEKAIRSGEYPKDTA